MHREVLGSIAVKKKLTFQVDPVYILLFTRDRIIAVRAGTTESIDGSNVINRSDILSSNEENFEIPYIQVR